MAHGVLTKLAIGISIFTLAACSGGGGNNAPTPVEKQFGSVFESAFKAGPTKDPIDPKAGDLPAVSATADPIDF